MQRVSRAQVTVAGVVVGSIAQGLLVLVGITHDDTAETATTLARKCAHLRIFDDEAGTMNCSLLDLLAAGEPAAALVVSQFTLYADTRRGRRPSYIAAAPPDVAAPLVERFAADLDALGVPVASGRFGAEMLVESVNDGPVTLWLDSATLGR